MAIRRWALRALCALLVVAMLGVIAGLRWQHPKERVSTVEPPFPLAVCNGQVSRTEAVVTSELLLHQELLPGGLLSEPQLRAAVALQLRYAFAVEQNDAASSMVLTPDGPPRSVERLEQKRVRYGDDVELDWPFASEIQPESDYVRRALARRHLAAADPALAVTYRARVVLAACEKSGTIETSFRFPVPYDPYLLYWHVERKQRTTQVYGEKQALTFPCATSEIADYDHPEYLWYFWQPYRKQPDCQALLRPARELAWASLRIVQRSPTSGDLTRLWHSLRTGSLQLREAPALRFVLVFGYLDHQEARPELTQVKECLTRRADESCAYDEFGTAQYARFVTQLRSRMEPERSAVSIQPHGLTAELSGRMPRSGRQAVVTAHLTETDFMAPSGYTPRHTSLLVDALRQAEVVVYAGHSGLGLNFSVAQLKTSAAYAGAADALRSSPVRVLGFIGCYTYSYFGRDFASLLKRPGETGQEAMFVYTGNAVSEIADSALHILETLDCILGAPHGRLGPEQCRLPPPGEAQSPDFLIYDYAR